MDVGQWRAQIPENDVLAQAGHALVESLEQPPGQVFFQGGVVGGALAEFSMRPFLKGLVAHEHKRLAGVMSGACPAGIVSGVHFRGVFERGHGQELHGRGIGLQGVVGQAERVQTIHINVEHVRS